MTSPLREALEQVQHLLQQASVRSELDAQFEGTEDAETIRVLRECGQVQRLLDPAITSAVARGRHRDTGLPSEKITTLAGCRDVTELIRRALRVDAGTARGYVRAADAVGKDFLLSSGEHTAARYEHLGQALRDGELSVTGLLAAISPVERAGTRISTDEREAVDALLANTARGLDLADEHGRPGPAPSTDELADYARALMLALDPDGAEPDDAKADRSRSFWIGKLRDGTHPFGGRALPEVAGLLQRLMDAFNNPAAPSSPNLDSGTVTFETDDTDPAGPDPAVDSDPGLFDGLPAPEDPRTPAQRNHDNFAAILHAAAASGATPDLGGAAPTLVVSVTAQDYAAGRGRAFIEGTGTDVPLSIARHTACTGGIQRVLFDEHGQIVSIGTTARIFTAIQRRAIQLRDRECLIPGCHVPATWCEIHHVQEHAHGGPTHTSNGVALCWHHHRTLDTSGWQIRMNAGVPEIRGPAWWDPHGTWHRPRIRGGDPQHVRRVLTDALGPPG
ncbi:DUF222 domain-containing protein [Microbacterium sp. 2MCAF23]|uniref:HNH endonuclease signature motif containing protein n=1 Tax=Microbacterium sp. 2MCAF23 TaxID=3232985 RepID=UPI003F9C8A98